MLFILLMLLLFRGLKGYPKRLCQVTTLTINLVNQQIVAIRYLEMKLLPFCAAASIFNLVMSANFCFKLQLITKQRVQS